MSLLDAGHEVAVRSRLPQGTTMFTGDDHNYLGLTMVGGVQSASLPQLSTVVRLADRAGALEVPDLAGDRWTAYLAVHGIRPQA